jgi:hypothetical protein
MDWKLWRWQRLQQLLGALAVMLPAAGFLYVLATDSLPEGDFRRDIPITNLDHRTLDHVHIATAIGSCHTPAPPASWPEHWLHTLRLDQRMLRLANDTPEGRDGATAPSPAASTVSADPFANLRDERLTSFERAAIYHSDRILQEREHYLEKAQQRQDRMRRNQLRILLLSAAGAFMVGMTTLLADKNGDAPFRSLSKGAFLPISALALLMPLLSTAMSGLVAFDDDGKNALRDLRTVAQLEQLHGRVAADVTSDPFRCPVVLATKELDRATPGGRLPANATKLSLCLLDKMRQTVAWEQRHEQILNDATQTLARAGDLARPSDGKEVAAPSAEPVRDYCRDVFGPSSQSAADVSGSGGKGNPDPVGLVRN